MGKKGKLRDVIHQVKLDPAIAVVTKLTLKGFLFEFEKRYAPLDDRPFTVRAFGGVIVVMRESSIGAEEVDKLPRGVFGDRRDGSIAWHTKRPVDQKV